MTSSSCKQIVDLKTFSAQLSAQILGFGCCCRLSEVSPSAGLLTEHHLLEINGQNVVGLKDKDTKAIIDECGDVLTITVMPSFVFEHMLKRWVEPAASGVD